MRKPETKFKENRVIPDLKRLERCWYLVTQEKAIRGVPDILASINGHFVALELKASRHREADRLQAFILERIQATGGMALVVNPENWAEVYQSLLRLSRGGNSPL